MDAKVLILFVSLSFVYLSFWISVLASYFYTHFFSKTHCFNNLFNNLIRHRKLHIPMRGFFVKKAHTELKYSGKKTEQKRSQKNFHNPLMMST